MTKLKIFIPFLLVLIVMSSGCTVPFLNIEIPGLPDIPGFGGPTVVQYEHDIVIINSLEAVPSEIDAGQTTKIIAYVQNIGDRTIGSTADDVVEIELYDYCQGLFSVSKVNCKGTVAESKCTIQRMLPDEIIPVVWTLSQNKDNPVNLRTICPPDGMKVSVKYHYATSGISTISFISEGELTRTLEERTFKQVESYIVLGQGPIKPYLTVEDKQPIPVYEGAKTVLQLQLKNLGSGQLASKFKENNADVIGIDNEKIIVEWETKEGLKDELKPVADDCKFEAGKMEEDVKLIGKQSAPYRCSIDLSGLKGVTKTATRQLRVSVEYDYLFTKSVQVVINPKFVGG
jgi:hypothetical protein